MLQFLSIRDLVLIDRLDLELRPGLCVLTGETGAGKSILLDALGLAMGARGDTSLVRSGAERAQVAAEFEIGPEHPARARAEAEGLGTEGSLILRRVINRDGRSRATLNDQPVSVGLLRDLGGLLVEMQAQGGGRDLLEPSAHLAFLDAFAGATRNAGVVAARWDAWSEAERALAEAEASMAQATADEEYMRHALAELDALNPKPGEERFLSEERARLRAAEQSGAVLESARTALAGEYPPLAAFGAAERALTRAGDSLGAALAPVIEALARAAAEATEAEAALEAAARDLAPDPAGLERTEERLFAIRNAARKYRVPVDALSNLRENYQARLLGVENGAERLASFRAAVKKHREEYVLAASALTLLRVQGAVSLDKAIALELPPLRLGKARFRTVVDRLDEIDWGRGGVDRVRFQVQTNPGHEVGELQRVASGGELGRFLLALRVVLAQVRPAPVLIFDEIDRGISGATADAVGERLSVLGGRGQVLVITHSPQVAARAAGHWRIEKHDRGGATVTQVTALSETARREEVARMLSGAAVTDEARAAADQLLAGTVTEPLT